MRCSCGVSVSKEARPGFGGKPTATRDGRVDKHVATEHQEDANELHGLPQVLRAWRWRVFLGIASEFVSWHYLDGRVWRFGLASTLLLVLGSLATTGAVERCILAFCALLSDFCVTFSGAAGGAWHFSASVHRERRRADRGRNCRRRFRGQRIPPGSS